MLESIDIKGLAIIDSLRMNFSTGFNVITGETGAGKSILIKALSILLGYKSGKDSIRSGGTSATISAEFKLDLLHPAIDILSSLDLPFDIDESTQKAWLIIRRSFNQTRSQCWINDTPVSSSTIKKLAPLLVDIFAQNESNQLLDPDTHLKYLDKFIPFTQRQKVIDCYKTSIGLLKKIEELAQNYKSKNKDKDYIQFRLNELDSFVPSTEDYNQLKSYCDNASSSYKMQQILNSAQSVVDGDGTSSPISSIFWKLSKDFSSLTKNSSSKDPSSKYDNLSSECESIAERVDQLSYSISQLMEETSFDENKVIESEQRLSSYQDLFRKFGVSCVEELLEEATSLKDSLGILENYQEQLITLINSLHTSCSELKKESSTLSDLRHKTGTTLIQAIEKELHSLSMPHAKIDLDFIPVSNPRSKLDLSFVGDSFSGLDKVNECLDILSCHNEYGREKLMFLLSANKGENLLPLNKVASGGEISRIMLALKQTLSVGADTCVLIFDEIDTGISGKVADLVGRKLKQLSTKFQVFCISHLAQVAVYGDTHFLVRKEEKSRTNTSIVKLSSKESIEEIARLLSGETITKSSLENAKNLKQKALSMELN